jgi:hypothetical protein
MGKKDGQDHGIWWRYRMGKLSLSGETLTWTPPVCQAILGRRIDCVPR